MIEYPEDVARIQRVIQNKCGISLTKASAASLWQHHSDPHPAGWLVLGEDDDIVSAFEDWDCPDEDGKERGEKARMSDKPTDGMGGEAPRRSAEGLIAMLKSNDHQERAKALDEIYPGGTVSLVIVTKTDQARAEFSMAAPPTASVAHLFAAFTWAGGQLGNHLGMSLKWAADPVDSNDKIVVATPGVVVP